MYILSKRGQRYGRWRSALFMGFVISLFVVGNGQAEPPVVGEIIPISDISPYEPGTECNGTPQTGTVWRNSETEPYMDVDPGNPDRMAAIVHQDRWSNGSAQSTATFYSDDGGMTWHLSHTPITRCSGGLQTGYESFDRASDPWLAVTPASVLWGSGYPYGDGAVFHQMSLMTDRLSPFTGELRSAYSMLRSKDGGRTWSDPIVVSNRTEFEPGAPFNDKNALTADPYERRFVYGTWQLLMNVQNTDDSAIPLKFFYSDTYFIRTPNMGKVWEPARAIYKIRNDETLLAAAGIDPAEDTIFGAQNIGHQIVVLPDGRLVNVSSARIIAEDKNSKAKNFLGRTIIRSYDYGKTWEQTGKIIPSSTIGGNVAFDFELATFTDGAIRNTVRSAGSVPDIAVNRTNGFIYVIWQDVDPTGAFIGVFMAMSKDGGDSWSDHITVGGGELMPDGAVSFAQLPAVHVADDGTVGVLFFDDRNDVSCPDLSLTNNENPECFTLLDDGSVKAGPLSQDWFFHTYDPDLNFISERRVTKASFDLRQAPVAGGYFPGDYVNCTSTDNDFVCAFTRTNNLGEPVRGNPSSEVLKMDEFNRQDMVFTRIPGESVCDFKYTMHNYISQLADAEIEIPWIEKIKRLQFLKNRYEADCQDNNDYDD